MRPTTRVVWCETPTNPLLNIADIAAAGRARARAPARCSSSTTPSPRRTCSSRSTLGADVVVHSTTKYLGGHSDVVGGALVTADAELGEQLAFHQNAMGAVAGPFDAWLVLRGIKTLGVRMDRHCANAARIVEFLLGHPRRRGGALPRAARPPRPRDRGEADARLRRHGLVPAARRRGGGARRSASGRSCSRWPSRSAASSR